MLRLRLLGALVVILSSTLVPAQVAVPTRDGVTGLPADVTPLLSMAGIWQPIDDGYVTAANKGQIANIFAGNPRLSSGLEGLVMSSWAFAGFDNTVSTVRPVTIAMLEQQPDGTLQLATSKYVSDPSTNGVGSVVVADFNRDGVDDVFLPAWNEAPNIPASSTAYLSNGGRYDRISVNDFIEAHGSNVATIGGEPVVFTAGYYVLAGRSNTVARFDGKADFTVIPDTGVGNNSSVAVADFYGQGTHAAAYGDFTYGPNYRYDATKLRGINLYVLANFRPTGNAFNVGTPYFDGKPEYARYESFWEPQKTHTYRVWADDFNQDAKVDLLAQAQIWSAAAGPQKNILQMFQNTGTSGNYAFRDVTGTLNPEYDEDCFQHEYQPQLRDLDGSGIKSYLFATTSYNEAQPACHYILVNDGTGRLHVALHETLNTYARQVLSWLASGGRLPSAYFLKYPPRLRAYRTPNGRLNFVAIQEAPLRKDDGSYVYRYVFVNVPLQLDLARQFTKPLTIERRNDSRRLRTFAGDDVIWAGSPSGATIDGGLGTNTVVYQGSRRQYSIAEGRSGVVTLTSARSAAIDTLIRVQRIQFSDE